MASKALLKIELGRESSAGTAVASSTLWRGLGVLNDQREVIFPDEQVGIIGGVNRSYIPKFLSSISMSDTEATFEQLPHVLEASIETATPSQDGAGSDYIYTYVFPTTAVNTIKTYTIEGGDGQQAEEMEYAFVKSFNLSGNVGEAWMVNAEWVGRQSTNATFTGSSIPAVEEILFNKTKLYIDASGGTIGSTQKTSTLLKANLSVTSGWHERFTGDGALYFTTHAMGDDEEIMLDITFEHDATAVAEKTAWRGETGRLIRLIADGSTVDTAGTTYSKKTLIIDLAGLWESFGTIEDDDGNDVYTGRFRALYSSTDSLKAQIVLVNELSSLP